MKKMISTKHLLCASVAVWALLGMAGCAGDTPEKSLASAQDYLAKSDTRSAIIQLKNALQKQSDLAPARFLLGRALLESGDLVAAVVELEKARDLKHPDEIVAPELARALVQQGKFKAVIDRYGATTFAQPAANADLQTSVATSHLSLGDRAAGERAIGLALASKPDHVPALMARVRLMAGQGQFDAALQLIDNTLTAATGNAELWALKGDVLLHGKSDTAAAEVAYRKALELRADYLSAHTGIVLSSLFRRDADTATKQVEALSKLAPKHPQTKFLQAQVALARGDDKAVRELSAELLRFAPNDPKLLHLAGAAELRSGSAVQAQTHLQKSLQLVDSRPVRILLAQSYVRSGQASRALSVLAPLLDGVTPDAGALAAAAQAHAVLGDLKKAESLYATASKLDPTDTKSKTALALTHLALGNADAAFGELQRISTDDAGTSADLALVHAYLRTGRFALAIEAIDGLERKAGGVKAASVHLRGLAEIGLQKPDAARKSWERALGLDENYFPAVENLALIELSEGKPELAAKRFENVLLRQPNNLGAQMALAALRARAGAPVEDVAKMIAGAIRSNPQDAMPRMKLIDLYVSAKKWGPALVSAQEGVAALPGSPELLDALGRVQALSGDSNQARSTFNRLVAMQPQSPLPHLRLAEIQRIDKNSAGAAQSLGRALAIQPNNVEAQRKMIALEVSAGRHPAALQIAKKVQAQRPKETVGYLLEGEIESSRRDMGAAIAAYRAGLAAAPDTVLAIKLHATLVHTGKRPDADAVATGWQKNRPKDAVFAMHLGQLALERGEFESAERQFATVLQLAPSNVAALNNLSWTLSKQGKKDGLAPALQANDLSPNQPPLMETLAVAMSLNDQLPKALEMQKKVVQLQPSVNAYRLTLAKMYIQAGQSEQARTELTVLANLGDKYAGQPEVAKMLKAL